jgi:hypothetical protein
VSLSDRERLKPIMAQLEASGHSVFLDLCELVLMLAEREQYGMVKWNHPRAMVHIKMQRAKREKGEGK